MAAQPVDMDVHGLGDGGAVPSPDFIHQLIAGKNLIGIGEELIEEKKFLLGKQLTLPLPLNGHGIVVQDRFANLNLLFFQNMGSAQQGSDS